MRFNRLDLNLLVALDQLLIMKSISKTAEKMNLSQPAMSNALARLREYFGDQLLVPVGRRMELTPRAKAMQFAVRDILVRIEATVSTELEFDPTESDREFRIILSDFTTIVLMPEVLALAHLQGPRLRFRLLPQINQPSLAIERGEADLLIVPSPLASSLHPSEVIFRDEFVCVAWAHGKHGRGPITRDAYLASRHIRVHPPNHTYSFEQDMLEKMGVEREVDIHCFSFAALPFLLRGTDRIATMQRSLAEQLQSGSEIAISPNPFAMPQIRQMMQWHLHRDTDPGLCWLRSLLIAAAAQAKLGRPD